MKTLLIEQLQAWDGKQSAYLEAIYQQHISASSFLGILVDLTDECVDLQVASTWLIKHHYDQKQTIAENLIRKLVFTFPKLTHWGAKLHMLQIVAFFPLNTDDLPYIEQLARKGLSDKNKFLRAWSYQGLFEVSKYMPEMQEEVLIICQEAMERESAAIKAKVRKIIAKLEKV